jgi:hypothetical protein
LLPSTFAVDSESFLPASTLSAKGDLTCPSVSGLVSSRLVLADDETSLAVKAGDEGATDGAGVAAFFLSFSLRFFAS